MRVSFLELEGSFLSLSFFALLHNHKVWDWVCYFARFGTISPAKADMRREIEKCGAGRHGEASLSSYNVTRCCAGSSRAAQLETGTRQAALRLLRRLLHHLGLPSQATTAAELVGSHTNSISER